MTDPKRPALRFRRAKPQDAPILHRIINIAYRTEQGWTTEANYVRDERITMADLQEHLAPEHSEKDPIFVAEAPAQQNTNEENQIEQNDTNAGNWTVVGCIQAELSQDHPEFDLPERSALLGLFAVDPQRQSQGIGGFLVRELLKVLLNEYHCDTAVMWVIQQRADIQQWYERLGFTWTDGQTRPFVYPDKTKQENTYFKVYKKKLV